MHHDDTSERWLPVPGFPGYEVSDRGRICSYRRRTPCIRRLNPARGYLLVHLSKDGKLLARYVHRLVLETFIGPCPVDMEAAHLDGYRANNRLDNLMWATKPENADHRKLHGTHPSGANNPRARLTVEQVLDIRRLRAEGVGPTELGRRYGVRDSYIHRIVRRELWKDV